MLDNRGVLGREPMRLLALLKHLRDNVDVLKRDPEVMADLSTAPLLLATEVNAGNYEQVGAITSARAYKPGELLLTKRAVRELRVGDRTMCRGWVPSWRAEAAAVA